jgi:ankyrin repeat protein
MEDPKNKPAVSDDEEESEEEVSQETLDMGLFTACKDN